MESEVELVEGCRRKEDGAKDLTQEIFLKVFRAIEGYDSKRASFATWLNRVARNQLVDHYRRTRKDRVTESPALSALLNEVKAVGGNWERIFSGWPLLHLLQQSTITSSLSLTVPSNRR